GCAMFGAIWPRTASESAVVPAPAAQAELQLVEVNRHFGGLRAVDQLSFTVRPGAILGIIGPNGAGKTTAVSLISGALRPTSGTIFFEGRNVSHMAPSHRSRLGIARTFQVTQPFTGLDVRE